MIISAKNLILKTGISFAVVSFAWLTAAHGQDAIKFAEAIKQFDQDHDGNLSVEEFRQLVESRRQLSQQTVVEADGEKTSLRQKDEIKDPVLIPWSASFPQLSLWVMRLPDGADERLDMDWLASFKNRASLEISQGYERLSKRLNVNYYQFQGSMTWNKTTFVSLQSNDRNAATQVKSDWMFYPLRTKRRNELWLQLNHREVDQTTNKADESRSPRAIRFSGVTRAYEDVSLTRIVQEKNQRWLVSTFIETRPSTQQRPLNTEPRETTAEASPPPSTLLKAASLSPEQISQLGSARFEIIERPYPSPVKISYDKKSQLMVVTGSAKDVASIQKSIQQIRRMSEKSLPQTSVIQIQVATARNLAQVLQSSYDEIFAKDLGPATIVSSPSNDSLLVVTGSTNAIQTIKAMVKQHESSAGK